MTYLNKLGILKKFVFNYSHPFYQTKEIKITIFGALSLILTKFYST